MAITKMTLRDMRKDINTALEAVAKKYNVAMIAGDASYTGETAKIKIQIASVNDDGTVMTPEREAFIAHHKMLGLELDALDKWFPLGANKFRVIGFRTRARKNPILLENHEGTTFVMPLDEVKRHLDALAA